MRSERDGGTVTNASLDDDPSGPKVSDIMVGDMGQPETMLSGVDLPLPFPYLNLALELYEASARAPTQNCCFLTLMNGMEALLSSGGAETAYSTSRNAAVLAATPSNPPEEVFKRMMGMFRKRGLLLFGQSDKKRSRIEEEEMEYIRSLLGVAIVRAYQMGFDKTGLLNFLNRCNL